MKPFKRLSALLVALSLFAEIGTAVGCAPTPDSTAETDGTSETDGMSETEVTSSADQTTEDTESASGAPGIGVETAVETAPPLVVDDERTLDPVFSIPGGMLEGSCQLTLSLPAGAPSGASIIYTTDGAEPTADGKRYADKRDVDGETDEAGGIPLLADSDCTVIRAAVFLPNGKQAGHIVTMSYLKAGVTSLRAISLVTAPDHLYGASGIFSDRTETGRAGERPVSVEIFETDGTVSLRQDAAVRLAGAGSRSFDPANLRVIARKPEAFGEDAFKYSGRGKFHARLWADSDCDTYDTFLLRCGGNDSLHQARDGFLRMNMLRDAIANNICANAEALLGGTVFAQRTEPVAVFLNGAYYGMLNLKQDFDEHLIESLYGLPEDGIALLKGKKDGKTMYYNVESGTDADLSDWQTLCAFCAEHALSADYAEAYTQVAKQLDVENFSRYYAVMLYLCNTDWPQNNTMVWRTTQRNTAPGKQPADKAEESPYGDGKWRAVIRDMDLCFALHDKASQTSTTTYSMADTDTFYRITVFYRDGGYRYDASLGLYDDTMGFQGLFDFLIRHEEFRQLFREACAALSSESFAALCRNEIDRYYTLTTPEIPAHLALWQSRGEIMPAYTLRHFKAAKQDMLDFVRDRPAYFEQYMNEALSYYE